jgi:hypothetical protein
MIGAATTVISIGLFLFAAKMKIQQEQWKAIAECNGEYSISDYGRVKSLKFGKERILKPSLIGNGYPAVLLSMKGQKVKLQCIHKLVASAFIKNPDNKPQVNHKDGNKLNNHIDNLEWMTIKENIQHAYDTGLFDDKRKKIAAACVLHHSKSVIDIITGNKYQSLSEACRVNNLKYTTEVSRIYNGYKTQRFFYL